MLETVALLRTTAFFRPWTVAAISRLFFWLEVRRYRPGEDVVKQGDDASFCFIIRSGSCEVLVHHEPRGYLHTRKERGPPSSYGRCSSTTKPT